MALSYEVYNYILIYKKSDLFILFYYIQGFTTLNLQLYHLL